MENIYPCTSELPPDLGDPKVELEENASDDWTSAGRFSKLFLYEQILRIFSLEEVQV